MSWRTESLSLEIPVCQGTFFISEKFQKIFLTVAKPATVDCENRAIKGKGGEKLESNGTSPSIIRTAL